MIKLHIFNPEHDIVLGKNNVHFTMPKAAVKTREAYGHLPALWASDGDYVLVDDIENARNRLSLESRSHADVSFLTLQNLNALTAATMPDEVEPWGWDMQIARMLVKANPLFVSLVPSNETLNAIRMLSSRVFTANHILDTIVEKSSMSVGKMWVANSMEEIFFRIGHDVDSVLKSPWSCSGRGVRFVTGSVSDSLKGWCRNVIAEQGAVIIEPMYRKVMDFAMEFVSLKDAGTRYLGLNIFNTNHGFYTFNIEDSEENKRSSIGKYVPTELLDIVCSSICETTSKLYSGTYYGPFGVDMMIVDTREGYRIHPCVEVNLRRTMGHASIPNMHI